jgi:hypothetical protein
VQQVLLACKVIDCKVVGCTTHVACTIPSTLSAYTLIAYTTPSTLSAFTIPSFSAFTHWGWADMDCFLGDLQPVLLPHLVSELQVNKAN